jgi:hypothetical protein
MKLSRAFVGFIFLVGISSPVLASDPGTSGGSFLNLGVGARAIGMGEAYTALADDVSSLYWNPAGIALLNQSEASFTYNPYLQDLSYQNAAVAVPLENGGLGASVSYLSYGKIQGFDEAGTPTSNVNAYSGVATLGGAWLGDFWSAGINVKGIQQSLADTKATGVAADLGATLVYPQEVLGGTLRGALVLRNLGTGLKYINQSDPFPRQWRVGVAALEMMDRKLNLSLDYGKERNIDGSVYAGAEYWLMKMLALRTGYAGSHTEGNGIRAGVGVKFKDLSFNYAYSNYGDLGFSNLYELSLRFGTIRPRLTPEERRMLRRAKIAMAHEQYGEATELLDSLIQMEPDYKLFRRLVKVAMAGYEKQDQAADKLARINRPQQMQMRGAANYDKGDLDDLESLLNLSNDASANAKANVHSAQESTR